jgi:glutathione synthase
MKLNMLVVTDHSTHAESNSVYQLSRALRHDPRCGNVWVCSRGLVENELFFSGQPGAVIYATPVNDHFEFDVTGSFFHQSIFQLDRNHIDAILVRMPQPVDPVFLFSLEAIVPPSKIINSPEGIVETATKAFLLQVSYLCPAPVLCNNLQEALTLSKQQEIVLKPLYSYGGRGIVRLSTEYCWSANDRQPLDKLSSFLSDSHFPMVAMKFLKNVTQGDKRTIVANWQILGSALRLPAEGSWMCNVAQGGHAVLSEPDEEERIIGDILTPMLHRKGVVIFGFDTLVDDDGRRVLSEINTLSIGGLVPLQEISGKPILKKAATLLWDYIEGEKA